jgi:hypothetical protein
MHQLYGVRCDSTYHSQLLPFHVVARTNTSSAPPPPRSPLRFLLLLAAACPNNTVDFSFSQLLLWFNKQQLHKLEARFELRRINNLIDL